MVEGTGEVTWADDDGRVGMLFSQLTPASRKHLQNWLGKRAARKKSAVRTTARSSRGRHAASASH
jgi:hypothetical protein